MWIAAAIVVVGVIIAYVLLVMRTSTLNRDPLQAQLIHLIESLVDSRHSADARNRFSSLAAAYFDKYGVKREGERRTRLAHALSYARIRLLPDDYDATRRYFRTWSTASFQPGLVAPAKRPAGTRTASNIGASVFLSYAREDQNLARIVVAKLQDQHFDVWWDEEIPAAAEWRGEIGAQLDRATVVIVLWSPLASVSEWVRQEAEFARANAKLVPAYLRKCRLPPAFAELHTLDLSEWPGDTDYPAWQNLVAAVKALADQPATRT